MENVSFIEHVHKYIGSRVKNVDLIIPHQQESCSFIFWLLDTKKVAV
jgi:hypothetical protein